MNDKSQVESILNDIKLLVNNIIIKLNSKAETYETVSIKREADKYVAAYLERDTFNSYRYYPMDVIAKAGITDLNELTIYSNDRHKIPREKQKDVLKAMRQTVIKEYVEMNDYYRELIGMPPVNTPEEEWIYLTEAEREYYEIDEIRPIHEYPKEIQHKLERDLIPQLIKLYPEKTYLQHMGSKAVNLVRAREAKNFEIIFTDVNLDTVFMRAFFETYDFAREYFMNIIYNKTFKNRYDLYDNYIGMHIMIMTVQRLIVDTIKIGIDRDFYDLTSIKKLFNVYGIPFFEDLPLDYQRTIMKNVNMLIRSKSTDKVLYDIANTLFYERVKIFKYYLVKERKFNENGEPIFAYKEIILDDDPKKYYIKSSNDKTYEIAVQENRLVTIESNVVYAPESIFIKNDKDEMYRLFMKDSVLLTESVENTGQIVDDLVLYNEKNEKHKLTIDDDRLISFYESYETKINYDHEKMFDVYFQATDIMEKNVISSLENTYNKYSYESVVSDDVYWWETEELKQELYAREYNFIDTKYISITVMQNLTKMIYESAYYLNLLIDHKNTSTPLEQRIFNSDAMKTGTDYLYIILDRFSSVPISIFNAVIILCALVSKKNGMRGNIIVESPSKIMSVLGFNFEANFDLIRENIKKYKRIFKNQEILKYLDLLDIKTVSDIDTLFNNFRNFTEFCSEVISTTNDINEYKVYKELYNIISVRRDSVDLFRMSDGSIATTYLEYLYDKEPSIATFIDSLDKDKTGVFIEHVIGKLNELIPEIEYLNTLNGTNNNIIQAIQSLINFFKSYTVDLRTLNVLYMFDNKLLNKIYMIDDPRLFVGLCPNEALLSYNDIIRPIIRFDKSNNLVMVDQSNLYTKTLLESNFEGYETIEKLITNLISNELINIDYSDNMIFYNKFSKNEKMVLYELNNNYMKLQLNDIFKDFRYSLVSSSTISLDDKLELDYKDIINILNNIINLSDKDIVFEKRLSKNIKIRNYVNDSLGFNEAINIIYDD
jgi:hypothetical protein